MTIKRYFGWANYQAMYDAFQPLYPEDPRNTVPKEEDILFAVNVPGDYEENAVIIFKKDNDVYLGRFGHCSCNGYEESNFDHATKVNEDYLRSYVETANLIENYYSDARWNESEEYKSFKQVINELYNNNN